jgi:hypothetical protein
MKRKTLLVLALFLIPALTVFGENNNHGGGSGGGRSSGGHSRGGNGGGHSARQPVVINMSHPSSGGHNQNFPSQQGHSSFSGQPSYGRVQWNTSSHNAPNHIARPDVKSYSSPGVRASVSVHHHPYTQGYVRKKLQNIGVKREPSYITDRAEIIHTDRAHSTIGYPRMGPDHMALSANAFSPRRFNDPLVRNHMALVDGADWRVRIGGFERTEFEPGRYYWHNGEGFNYCHYVDGSGYHWWGWYLGNQFFWTRNFGGRYWWYDSGFNRWCFWNEGFWWWQDPYHVGDLYCYNNDTYVPTNSADDQVVVTSPETSNFQTYTSLDGTRMVKVATDTQDAFLYDTASTPSFSPIYLASGVQSVQFSDTSNGRPLEVILKLNDGSFDMFDGNGNSYNSGSADTGEGSSADGDSSSAPPSDGGAPPSDSNAPAAPGQPGT